VHASTGQVEFLASSSTRGCTLPEVAYYLFNAVPGDAADGSALRRLVAQCLAVGMWGIRAGEPHSHALASGDLTLVYLGAPERVLMGRANVASAVHAWTSSEAQEYPGDSPGGVLLASVEQWDPPVRMENVLLRIDQSEGARADFDTGVVRITPNEYETALAVAAEL
jgi:hypothetical protein